MQTFGVEMEFTDAYFADVRDALNDLKLTHPFKCSTSDVQPRSTGKDWHLKYDISVCDTFEGKRIGGEIASPAFIASKRSFTDIQAVMNALLNCDSEPSFHNTTGFHVHVDLDDIDRFTILMIWLCLEKEIFKLFPTRKYSRYAKSLHTVKGRAVGKPVMKKLADILATKNIDEICGGKTSALYFYERNDKHFLEIRIGQMCDDPFKITGWTKICVQIVTLAKEFKEILNALTYEEVDTFAELNRISPKELKLTKAERVAVGIEG